MIRIARWLLVNIAAIAAMAFAIPVNAQSLQFGWILRWSASDVADL